MLIGVKDIVKLFGISIIACCAVFVCTLFLNYNIDLAAIKDEVTTEAGKAMYDAQVLMGKMVAGVSGGCLVITSVVMLLFYVKNYVDTHGKELGILKAIGYSDMKIAKYFWTFGLSVLVGCVVGFAAGYSYLPKFYKAQTPDFQSSVPAVSVGFHPSLCLLLTVTPAAAFACVSVAFAYIKLKTPVMNLLFERQADKVKNRKRDDNNYAFLKSLFIGTLKNKKSLVFFVAFSAFCFSAMVQMSYSMNTLAAETFAYMILAIGLILAFVTLFLSLSSVVKGNAKRIAIMKAFGYENGVCGRYVFGAYRPVAFIGFVIGSAYQYGLLKFMVAVVFANVQNVPSYTFDIKACLVTFVLFVVVYELTTYLYSLRVRKLTIKSVMIE